MLTVIGSFVVDLIFKTHKRPVKGETIIGDNFFMVAGGKGANQAVAAAKLGAEVYMVGRVGQDTFGDMQLESLIKSGVNVTYVIKDKTEGTGVASIVLDKEGDNSIIVIPRANMACIPEDVNAAKDIIINSDFILLQLEIPSDVNINAINIAKTFGAKIILDPAPAPQVTLDTLFFETVDIMTPNEIEASKLSGINICSIDTAAEAAKKISHRGVKTVIITLGDKGCFLHTEDIIKYFPPLKVDVKDTTAAGDAFTASLAVWLSEGYHIEESVRRANITGALCTTKIGAQPSLPNREELLNFLN